MNKNLLSIVKQIASQYGEDILEDPKRLKSFFSDLAKDEPKTERIAFGRCVEKGAYRILKNTSTAEERRQVIDSLALRIREEEGLDLTLCTDALELFVAALFGEGAAPRSAPAVVPAGPLTPILNFMIFILDWSKSKAITEILEESHVRFHFICKGRGTASSEVLDLLGLGSSEKAVVICLEQNLMVPVLLKRVSKSLGLHNPGAGIAYTVPLSSINKPVLQVFKESIHKNISDEEKKEHAKMKEIREKDAKEKEGREPKKYDLIIIVANQGCSDDLMACAREAGASGGTVINARGLAHQGPVKFFGISVQDEKEIIMILTSRKRRISIMQAVSKNYGIASSAQAIVFSLPAEHITGLDLD